ncbi:MAG: toxin-antitoxin system HicB family antitoxin [Methyloprofundus sp.]|nr:toxin-antitoxin system HicB family antitoxin [Methyloprofundus sp.]
MGRILGIKDIIGFHGDTVKELKTAFYESVDDYNQACKAIGKKPQKPYSGNLMLRIPPEVHAAVATAAEVHGMSINQWASDALLRESELHF